MDPAVLKTLREQSGLRLDGEGRFWHRGELVEHERTALALHRGLHRAADGRWATRIGNDWAYLQVDDVAYFVRAVAPAGGRLRADLIDGTEASLDPAQLSIGANDALYATLPNGERARLTRAAQLSLSPFLREYGGAFSLELDGQSYSIGKGQNL